MRRTTISTSRTTARILAPAPRRSPHRTPRWNRAIASAVLAVTHTAHCTQGHHHSTTGKLLASVAHSGLMTHCASAAEKDGSKDVGNEQWRRRLTPAQYQVLRNKGTDPMGGQLDDFFGEGNYNCAACGSLLYTSAMKFACGCGWPGFYDCVPKAVREQPDADGRRSEIVCNACNSHLGHVFRGERFDNPPPNERHCVNSTSLTFVPKSKQ